MAWLFCLFHHHSDPISKCPRSCILTLNQFHLIHFWYFILIYLHYLFLIFTDFLNFFYNIGFFSLWKHVQIVKNLGKNKNQNCSQRPSLVAQWLRIRLPMQGTRVRALVQEDPTCRGATKPVHHNYWACALEPASHNYWAHVPQLLKPAHPRARAPQ